MYRGDFSRIINEYFPNSKLYLFDTFEGFDERDIEYEKEKGYSNPAKENFMNTTESIVLSKMKFPDQIAKNVDDTFGFVSLDFDLYQPILAGLKFFYPKMLKHACILVHDYFHIGLPGVRQAISDFEQQMGIELIKLPIGDELSIAILKG